MIILKPEKYMYINIRGEQLMKVNKKSILMYKKYYMEKFEELGIKPISLDNRNIKTRKKHTR